MIESTEKLRNAESFAELAINIIGDDIGPRSVQEFWCALADAIEAEIAERYIELPVDADGVPIRIGDKLYPKYGDPFTCFGYRYVMQVGYVDPHWEVFFKHGKTGTTAYLSAHSCRHANPRTIEDVLAEFVERYNEVDNDPSHYSVEQRIAADNGTIEKYADELRELMGRDYG